MPMPRAEIERLIREALPDARVEVRALADDEDHYEAYVQSAAFRGLHPRLDPEAPSASTASPRQVRPRAQVERWTLGVERFKRLT